MRQPQQQVNLYQANFRKTRVRFSAMEVLRLTLVVIAALTVFSAYNANQTQALRDKADALGGQVINLQMQIETLRQSQAHGGPQEQVHTVAKMKETRDARQRALNRLSRQREYQNRLFSSYFEGLARRTLDGIWLHDIQIDDAGESITLTGNTHNSELIPRWIIGLKDEPAFAGVVFASAELSSDESEKDLLQFSLRTDYKREGDSTQ